MVKANLLRAKAKAADLGLNDYLTRVLMALAVEPSHPNSGTIVFFVASLGKLIIQESEKLEDDNASNK